MQAGIVWVTSYLIVLTKLSEQLSVYRKVTQGMSPNALKRHWQAAAMQLSSMFKLGTKGGGLYSLAVSVLHLWIQLQLPSQLTLMNMMRHWQPDCVCPFGSATYSCLACTIGRNLFLQQYTHSWSESDIQLHTPGTRAGTHAEQIDSQAAKPCKLSHGGQRGL